MQGAWDKGGKDGDRAHDIAQTDDHDGGIEEGPLHLVIEEMIMDALRATTGEEAWLALRRAARTSRAQWAETLGTVACEIQERWGEVTEYKHTNDDIKAVCEQEDIEERGIQGEDWKGNRDRRNNH